MFHLPGLWLLFVELLHVVRVDTVCSQASEDCPDHCAMRASRREHDMWEANTAKPVQNGAGSRQFAETRVTSLTLSQSETRRVVIMLLVPGSRKNTFLRLSGHHRAPAGICSLI